MKARRWFVPAGIVLAGIALLFSIEFAVRRAGPSVQPIGDAFAPTVRLEVPPVARESAEAAVLVDEPAIDGERRDSVTLAGLEQPLDVRVLARETREPLSGVRLSLHEPGNTVDVGVAAVSDDDGRASIATRGRDAIVLVADGHWIGAGEGEVLVARPDGEGAPWSVTITLETRPEQRFFVRAIDATTGAPLGEARATLELGSHFFPGEQGEELLAARACDEEGVASFHVADFGRDVVRLEHEGHATRVVQVIGGHSTRWAPYEVELERASSLAVTVQEEDGRPAVDVELELWAELADLVGSAEAAFFLDRSRTKWGGRTTTNGVVTLHDLPPSVDFNLLLRRGGRIVYQEHRSGLAAGERATLTRRLGDGCVVEGFAPEASGAPAAGVEMWLARATGPDGHVFRPGEREGVLSARTDGHGRFRFDGLGAGSYWVGPAPREQSQAGVVDPGAIAPFARVFEVGMETEQLALDVPVHRGLYVTGRVLGIDGAPVANARVGHWSTGSWVRTDETGAFAYGPLVPGEYTLGADDPASSRMLDSAHELANAGDGGLVLRFDRGSRVVGRVVDATTGRPIAAEVRLLNANPGTRGVLMQYTRSDEDGRFAYEGVVPGSYHVVVASPGWRFGLSHSFDLGEGQSVDDLSLAVEPAAQVRLSLEAPRKQRCTVMVHAQGTLIGIVELCGGVDSLVTVPAGPVTFLPLGREIRSGEKVVEAIAGAEVVVEFATAL